MSEEKPAKGTQCFERVSVPGSFRGRSCGKAAKVIRDGNPYCGIHDPVKVKERREKRNADWEERWEAEKAARAKAEAERAERDRRADCFDDLLAAVELMLPLHEACGHVHAVSIARAAIAKARGE